MFRSIEHSLLSEKCSMCLIVLKYLNLIIKVFVCFLYLSDATSFALCGTLLFSVLIASQEMDFFSTFKETWGRCCPMVQGELKAQM